MLCRDIVFVQALSSCVLNKTRKTKYSGKLSKAHITEFAWTEAANAAAHEQNFLYALALVV
jgi:hypothetical protein